jgi:hypothetical protein
MTRTIPSHDEHDGLDRKEQNRLAEKKRQEKLKRETMERKAFSVEVFGIRNGISRRQAFYELSSGRIEARKLGSRTIITERAERKWQDALPKVTPREAEALNDHCEYVPRERTSVALASCRRMTSPTSRRRERSRQKGVRV